MKTVLNDMKNCTGCGCCENICSHGAIKMSLNEEGFYYPAIDNSKCVACNICTMKCPANNEKTCNESVKLYAAYSEDDNIRLKSSSGGIFYFISKYVIENNGVVFGAEFDKDFFIRHGYTESITDINRFQTSKYVQSYIGDNLKNAENF